MAKSKAREDLQLLEDIKKRLLETSDSKSRREMEKELMYVKRKLQKESTKLERGSSL